MKIAILASILVCVTELHAHEDLQSPTNSASMQSLLREEESAVQFWSNWPRDRRHYPIFDNEHSSRREEVERRFRCRFVNRGLGEWSSVLGVRLIVCNEGLLGSGYLEYHDDGRLIRVTSSRQNIPELVEYDRLVAAEVRNERENWARERGMTYAQATNAYAQAVAKFPSLARGRAGIVRRRIQNPLANEKEQAEQRAQLLGIRNSLIKLRESKARKAVSTDDDAL